MEETVSAQRAQCAQCGQPATHRCASCREAAYCGRQHQRAHWPQHKASCCAYEVRTSDDVGRHLVAARYLSGGGVVLSEAPLVVGPPIHVANPVCLGCLTPLDPDGHVSCVHCTWPMCSERCAHDDAHVTECHVLRTDGRPRRRPLCYTLITPLRCLLLRRHHPRRWAHLQAMEAHLQHRGPGTSANREVEDNVVRPFMQSYVDHVDMGEDAPALLRRVCGILDVNALEVTTPGGGTGIALYPNAYLLEHNCVPNTRHSFDATPGPRAYRITVRTSRPVRKGEHVTTMYTHALWGTASRRRHLAATKYFWCACSRCADPTELGTHLSALRCLNDCCDGWLLATTPLDDDADWHCDRCDATLTSDDVHQLTNRLGDEVDDALQTPSVATLEDLLGRLTQLLHPHHYHCYAVKHSLLQMYGGSAGCVLEHLSDAQLQRKLDMCEDLLRITRTLDAGWSRLALYGAVLLHQRHGALVECARRGRRDASAALEDAASDLEEALSIVQEEPPLSAGAKMADIVRNAQRALSDARTH